MAKHAKKEDFTGCAIKALTTNVEARKCVLFGVLSSDISNKRKSAEWITVTTPFLVAVALVVDLTKYKVHYKYN